MNDGWRRRKRKRENHSGSGHYEQQLEDRSKERKTRQHLEPTSSRNVHQLECKEEGRKRSRKEEKERGREWAWEVGKERDKSAHVGESFQ